MKARCRIAAWAALLLPLVLTGCQLFPTTRKLPMPKAPSLEQSITPEQLVDRMNQRWAAINSLTAKVEIRASVSKSKEGVATDYPSVEGHILIRKPADLRVVGIYFPVKVFDMASSGECFTLSIPHYDEVMKGCGASKKKSANTWENLRPDFFFDAMLVRGLAPEDEYYVTSDSVTVEDAARKHLYTVPEYKLYIVRRMLNSQQLKPLRVVSIHRDDLQPYQLDIYDDKGNLETQVTYASYQDFEGSQYPSTVTIKRPMEEVTIILTVESVKENQPLADDQFVVQIPASSKIKNME
jgi:hypothetical protein